MEETADNRTLTRVEAAAYLTEKGRNTKVSTLAKYAGDGRGPPFTKEDKHVVYKQSDLDAWFAQGMSRAAGGGRPRKPKANGTRLPSDVLDLRATLAQLIEFADRFASDAATASDGYLFARSLDRLRRLLK